MDVTVLNSIWGVGVGILLIGAVVLLFWRARR